MSDQSPPRRLELLPLAVAVAGLAAGGVAWVVGVPAVARVTWGGATLVVLLPTALSVLRGLLRGEAGVDLIAVLAMGGALALGELLAGAIISVMLTGGSALERYAAARARRELTALLERAPRVAHRRLGSAIVDVDVSEIAVGDRLIVKPGEIVPTDGILDSERGVFDESALTGESRLIELATGDPLRSGAVNAGPPLELRATAPAAQSTYAGILRLVRAAEESKAPFVRLADRYAIQFLFLTLLVAGAAWALSGEPVRALAVLVVATPCPLILAAPAAIIAGVSRAARHGIIIKGGGPLETLAGATVVLLDKTGTITSGRPRVVEVEVFGELGADELVRLAASIEQLSMHPFAPAILAEARDRGMKLSFPEDAREQAGAGILGTVDGRRVAVGHQGWVAPGPSPSPGVRAVQRRTAAEGSSSAFVSVDGALAGAFILEDPIRTEAPRALQSLRKVGIRRIHMVTGDHPDIAELVGDAVGIDQVFAERTPEEKVTAIDAARAEGTTIMIGDGVNDAPALALADVGIAMGARGAAAASEAADVVLTADRLEGLYLAVQIAQRTRRIALQSVLAGMGMSLLAMIAAAAGLLVPVAGAVLQEGIDLAVILNALRALGGGGLVPRTVPRQEQLGRTLRATHRELRPRVEEIAALAARLDALPPPQARQELVSMRDFLIEGLLPHEREEEGSAYPLVAGLIAGEDPTGPLIRTHYEIARLARLFARMVDRLPPDGPQPEDLRDLRRILYGLHAILTLHFAQEDELYLLLGGPRA